MKKKRINEKMGGGSRIGLGGMNSDGPHYPRYGFKNPTGYHTGGYTGNADSQISQRHALISTLEEQEQEEEKEMSEEKETLYEYFARIAKLTLNENKIEEGSCNIKEGHCSTHESKCTMSESQCDESIRLEEELSEISAGGIAGVATPLGTNAKGKVPSNKERQQRLSHAKRTFGGK